MGTLSPDEKTMHLAGYVRVRNQSGEDYDNAQTRLIVGKVNLLDRIAELARRRYPYGRPGPIPLPVPPMLEAAEDEAVVMMRDTKAALPRSKTFRKKEIKKESLSEYFLYTIEGTESIQNTWAKRLPSFETADIPVVNLYKYEEERYGGEVVRFLSFKNDKQHKLGETPIPGGMLKVYRAVDDAGRLAYEGESSFEYIPVDQKVELNLGSAGNVVVKPTLMDYKTDNYLFNNKGDISGWDETRTFKVEVNNTRQVPVRVEIKRNFNSRQWEMTHTGDAGTYEKVDLDTVKFTLELPAKAKKEFSYTLTVHHGKRAE